MESATFRENRTMTTLSTAKSLLGEALGTQAAGIPDDAAIANTPGWDSIVHLRLILAIEAQLRRQLDSEEAVSIESLSDVVGILKGAERPTGRRPGS
jgi:acyl carrier protein